MNRRASGPKKVVVTDANVKAAGSRATKASAKLEGREVPNGHQRTAAVAAYIEKQRPQVPNEADGQSSCDRQPTDPVVPCPSRRTPAPAPEAVEE